jgi:nickel transport system substrate-binding protein
LSYDAYSELSGNFLFGTAVNDTVTMTRYIGLNLSKAPFDDVLVRQAIAYAIDKATICSAVFQGIEQPAETLFKADKPYCDVDQTTYVFDLDKANALMDEAGWLDNDGDGIREKGGQKLEFTLIYYTQSGSIDDAVLTIANQLSEIGFQVTPSGTDMMSWFGVIGSGDYGMTMYGTYGGAYDPSTVMSNINPDDGSDPVVIQVASALFGSNALILELDCTAIWHEYRKSMPMCWERLPTRP